MANLVSRLVAAIDATITHLVDIIPFSSGGRVTSSLARVFFWPSWWYNKSMIRASSGKLSLYNRIDVLESTEDKAKGKVFLGSLPYPKEFVDHLLRTEKITVFVNMIGEPQFDVYKALLPPAVTMKHFPMTDFARANDVAAITDAVKCVSDSVRLGQNVYVHCKAGKNRSATVVLCYMIQSMGVSSEAAQKLLQVARPQVVKDIYLRPVVKSFSDRKNM